MRKGTLLLLFTLISSSFGFTVNHLNCTDGIIPLAGSFIGENAYYINGTTFVKCTNQTLLSNIYGPHSNNSSIFSFFGAHLTSHSKYLYLYLNHTGNFTISNYTISFNETSLKISNETLNYTGGLINITFTNSTFTLLNHTFPYSVDSINTSSFLGLSFESFGAVKDLVQHNYTNSFSLFDGNQTYLFLTVPQNKNVSQSLFYFYSIGVNYSKLKDPFNLFSVIRNSTCDDFSYLKIGRYSYVLYLPFKSLVFSLSNYGIGNYYFVFNTSSICGNLSWYQHVTVSNVFDGFKYVANESGLYFFNENVGEVMRDVFQYVFGVRIPDVEKINFSSDKIVLCKNTTCASVDTNVSYSFNLIGVPRYTFTNPKFNVTPIEDINSSYFNLSLIPNFVVYTPNCNSTLNITKENNTVTLNSSANFVTCGLCFNLSYTGVSNQTCVNVKIDEPELNITINGTTANYTIKSKSTPFLYAFYNGNNTYHSVDSIGQFTIYGNMTIVYGNAAGNRTYLLIVNSTNVQNNTNSSSNSNSGGSGSGNSSNNSSGIGSTGSSSSGGSSKPYSGSGGSFGGSFVKITQSNQTKNSTEENSDIILSNKSIENYTLPQVTFGVTGKFISVDNDTKPIYLIALIPIAVVTFLIVKSIPRIERRIIE